MIQRILRGSVILLLGTMIGGCALLHTTKEEDREARCKVLNQQIIFNAATADQTLATRERAELDTLNRNYREEGCDQ